MPWAGGVYTRGYPSWSADAAGNLPISATKFDTEDNDFASGISSCLNKDGSNSPTAALTWSIASAKPLSLVRTTTDGAVFSLSRTGGANNPVFSFTVGDTAGLTIGGASGGLTLVNAGNVSVAAPTSGIALTVAGFAASAALQLSPASASLGFNLVGTDIAQGNFASVASTSRAAILFTQGGTSKGFIGSDGGQAIIAGSTNGDLCLASNGSAMRFSTAAGGASTQMSIGTTGAVVIAAPSSGSALAMTSDGTNTPLIINSAALSRAVLIDSTNASGVYFQLTNSGTNLGQFGSSSVLFTGTLGDLAIRSQNNFTLGTVAANIIFTLASAGNVTLAAPNSGIALTVNGFSGTHSTKIADSAAALFNAGFLEAPQNLQSGTTYTCVLADSGKDIHATNAGAKTITIPANASVAYPIGTILTFTNAGAGNMTIAITTDTMNLSPAGTTGSRTLTQFGVASAVKVAATTWYISGSGLT